MLQEVQVFFISPLSSSNRINDESLQSYKYIQYMGYNKNASILCSLIHYAFNKQISRILESILQLINTLKNQTIYTEFVKLIKQTKFEKNHVQKFFQNLYLIDQNNEIAGKLLFDLCKSKDWLDGSQIAYNQIAKEFQLRISIYNCNEVYGIQFKETIDLMVDANKKFYFLISEPIFKNIEKTQCPQCKIKSEFILLTCNHKHCYKCLRKKSQIENIKCHCGKICYKKNVLHCLQNFDKVKEYNEMSKVLLKYYESANSSVALTDQQLSLDRSRRYHANQDIEQKIAPTVEPLYECSICSKKSQSQLLVLEDCKHQFCYYCAQQYKLQKECPLQNCIKKIEQNSQQTCLNKNNSKEIDYPIINQNIKESIQNSSNPKVAEQCSRCSNTSKYKLFEVKKCNHKFCKSCLSNIEMKYELAFCLKPKCQSTFTKQEYKMYFKSVQPLSNSEVPQMQRVIPPQNQYSSFDCESCKYKRSEDQKYILNCGHSICNACIILNVQFKTTCCYLAALDSEYQQFRKNMTTNCKGCQLPFQIKELFQSNCKHEFCLSCCQKIYLERSQRCLEKRCGKLIFFVDDLYNFIWSQKIEESKDISNKEVQKKTEELEEQDKDQNLEKQDNKQIKEDSKQIDNSLHRSTQCQKTKSIEEQESPTLQKSVINLKEYKINEQKKEEINLPSTKLQEIVKPNGQNLVQNGDPRKQEVYQFEDDISGSEENYEEEIIIYQQIEEIKSAKERENEFCKGNCTNCNSEFSPFNKKQLIDCKLHQIGACCILNKFIRCPQCEQTPSKKIIIHQKLILPCNPVEEESIFESTILKPSLGSYYPQSFQQTYKGYSDQLQRLERQRNNQNSAIKRNLTTDTVNKRIQDNQQVLEDKSKYKNEQLIQNELTLLKSSPPYLQQPYHPYRYERLQYGGYDQRNRLELYSRDFHLNSKITTGYSGRLY
ncbi:unnamed protein product (macronuclear) [Paramecium tetraurelia]|uniref:RING-type domain-containing protein n=1 Tax=Paramecium tetraurelia TaxID=5888 RepID=A0CF51_PARTE|nr:uncharacterized protein GSPATT00037857001 [Paramecium tetraurelia]CAK69418.1 unnamed protein product [Paramecium tetraurelia]|eukprot:XP_001436815.1 hypothetical protein (macronuclear) [Paramecium tetraurelia strain d4-2]